MFIYFSLSDGTISADSTTCKPGGTLEGINGSEFKVKIDLMAGWIEWYQNG